MIGHAGCRSRRLSRAPRSARAPLEPGIREPAQRLPAVRQGQRSPPRRSGRVTVGRSRRRRCRLIRRERWCRCPRRPPLPRGLRRSPASSIRRVRPRRPHGHGCHGPELSISGLVPESSKAGAGVDRGVTTPRGFGSGAGVAACGVAAGGDQPSRRGGRARPLARGVAAFARGRRRCRERSRQVGHVSEPRGGDCRGRRLAGGARLSHRDLLAGRVAQHHGHQCCDDEHDAAGTTPARAAGRLAR